MSVSGATQSLTKGVLTQIEVAGEVAGEVGVSAGNLAKTAGKIAENAGIIALKITENVSKNTGELTDNAGQIAIQTTKAGQEAASALTHVVSVAKNLSSAANSLAQRADASIKLANEKRAIVAEQEKKLLAETSANKTATDVAGENSRLEIEKQKIERELLEETKKNDVERTRIEVESQKLKKEFERAQIILSQTQQVAEVNTYIGTQYGYKDSDCIKLGWNSSTFTFSRKRNFYMVIGIMGDKNNYLQVKFNKEDGKDGYYVINDGYVYKLQIIPNFETRRSLITRKQYYKELPSFAKIIHVKYIPSCFTDDGTIQPDNNDVSKGPDTTKYSIITKLEEFIDNSRGGPKSKKKKMRNMKTRKTRRQKRSKKR